MIRKWHVKASIQALIAALPASTRLNYLFQHLTGGTRQDDRTFYYKISHAAHHVENYRDRHAIVPGKIALELGTGWFPVVPIYLFLCGFDRIWSVDVNKWLLQENVIKTLQRYVDWKYNGKLEEFSGHILPERWVALEDILAADKSGGLHALCEHFNFHPINADARQLAGFADSSIDLICSNNTFANIPPEVLGDILIEFKRLLKSNGVMSHHADVSDNFSNFDSSISKYNYLYVGGIWRFFNNRLSYQNRLRFIDFMRMYDDIALGYEQRHVMEGRSEQIRVDKLVPPFSGYPLNELAILGGYLVTYGSNGTRHDMPNACDAPAVPMQHGTS